jgi:putative transposase
MRQYYPNIGLGKLCRLFGKTRQGYYDHQWRDTDNDFAEMVIIERVKSIRNSLDGSGGKTLLPIVRTELEPLGISIGRDRFFDLLREHNLLIKPRKRYVRTTDSNHSYRKWPDLSKELRLTAIEQLWVSDITYLQTQSGFVFLSLIMDAYSRKIVGYHLSRSLKAEGCLIALNKAIRSLSEKQPRTLIHHSDRGVQYCCDNYVTTLLNNNIRISMTQSGSPYDNAASERLNGILKHIAGLNQVFKDYNAAVAKVCKSINAYNCLRPHTSVSKLTPEKAHLATEPLINTWKKEKKQCPLPINSKGNTRLPDTG